jgi:superfamily II DNA or RNA helicase
MGLRKHQKEMSDLCDRINNGDPINEIICDVTPGGGKTGLGIIATKKLTRGFADKAGIFVPRTTLQYQFESDMLDPFFDSGRTIRAADNTKNPTRGLDGFSTTYQALGSDHTNYYEDFGNHKYIKICDEYHHISEGPWSDALSHLRERSKLNIYMTGTAYRQTGNISFLPYGSNGLIDRTETPHRKFITYTRSDALAENAIVPIEFETIDGSGSYKKNNEIRVYQNIEHKDLQPALMSDYAYQLIDHGLDKFLSFRKYVPEAQCIVVAKDIATAREYCDHINRRVDAMVVSSDDKDSVGIINQFKAGKWPVLCGIGIPYEGLNVPNVSDLIALTHIRSFSWLTQMTARAVRTTKWNKEYCRVTAPADPEFLQFMSVLINEQDQVCGEPKSKPKPKEKGTGKGKPEIEIFSGEAHIPPSAKEKLLREEINMLINSHVGLNSVKEIDGRKKVVHTESMRRRKILWYKIYVHIGRKCQLKEMTYDEMNLAKDLLVSLTN